MDTSQIHFRCATMGTPWFSLINNSLLMFGLPGPCCKNSLAATEQSLEPICEAVSWREVLRVFSEHNSQLLGCAIFPPSANLTDIDLEGDPKGWQGSQRSPSTTLYFTDEETKPDTNTFFKVIRLDSRSQSLKSAAHWSRYQSQSSWFQIRAGHEPAVPAG